MGTGKHLLTIRNVLRKHAPLLPEAGAECLREVLGAWGQTWHCRRVICQPDTRPVVDPHYASVVPVARLLVCLAGKARYRLAGRITPLVLRPGEALFLPPHTWVANVPRSKVLTLGLIGYPQTVRAYLVRYVPAMGPLPPREHLVWSSLTVPAPPLVPALLEALQSGTGAAAGSPWLTGLADLLVQAVARAGDAPDAPLNKAQATYHALCHALEEQAHLRLTRTQLARHCRVHPNHVSRLFAQYAQQSFAAQLRTVRLQRAARLLADPRLTVAEVAAACGYQSPAVFIRNFRALHGLPPGQWRHRQAR